MKILQVTPYFPPAYAFGGPVKVAYQISRELIKRGHEVVVYTTNAKDFGSRLETDSSNIIEGMRVHRFRNLSLTLVKKLKLFITPQLALFARKEVKKFNIVHLHEYRTFQNIVIHHYARRYDVSYVLQAHGSIPRIGKKELKWIYDIFFGYRLLRDASKVIALSRVEAEQYRSMGVPEEKIVILPNGIDLSEYAELPPKGSFKKKFNIPEDRKIILYLGRIHKIKGIDFLIKAYSHLKNKINFKDVVLVIAGPDDGYLSEIKHLAQASSVSNSILFVGPLYGEDKLAAYVDSEVYVLPSRYETFPMTILEAYACGKPIVASKVGGLKDLVKDEETGLLFEPGNVEQLAKSIFNLLNGNDVAKEMGLRGKNFIRENLTVEKVVERLEKVYEEVVKNRVS
jgi:glycosyltransferase involved in cell wall biosynthesis